MKLFNFFFSLNFTVLAIGGITFSKYTVHSTVFRAYFSMDESPSKHCSSQSNKSRKHENFGVTQLEYEDSKKKYLNNSIGLFKAENFYLNLKIMLIVFIITLSKKALYKKCIEIQSDICCKRQFRL